MSKVYFMTVFVNQQPLSGYMDTGSCVNTIRKCVAEKWSEFWQPCTYQLTAFGGSVIQSIAKMNVQMEVDVAKASVEIVIVPDLCQRVDVIIGQPFLNQANVNVMISGGEVRIFNKDLAELTQLEAEPQLKIPIMVQDATTIPGKHFALLNIYVNGLMDQKEIYIEGCCRSYGTKEFTVSPGVMDLSVSQIIIENHSDKAMNLKKDSVVVRGSCCMLEPISSEKDNKITTKSIQKFSADQIVTDVDNETKLKVVKLLNNFRDCFAFNLMELGATSLGSLNINLNTDKQIRYRPYRLSIYERQIVKDKISEMLQAGIIKESQSEYASPIVLVKKKNGDYRMCVDYRSLNRITTRDFYPLPRIDDQIDYLKGKKWFTTLDLFSGYYQIPIDNKSVPYTSFVTPDGQYVFLRMPFGLTNAPATFQRTLNNALGDLKGTIALPYIDDILIPSENVDVGIENLEKVLIKCREAKLSLNLKKCSFLMQKIMFLGYELSKDGMRPGLEKISAVQNFKSPSNVHQVRQFLGLASYFRKFVKGFGFIANPLTSLLKKNQSFIWGNEQETAFVALKDILCKRPVLAFYDPSLKTELHTDASAKGLGGILLQHQVEGGLKPVMYFSRQTTPEENKYHSYELETLAVIESFKKFRVYLLGISFLVITDCNALRTTFTKKDLLPRVARWWLTAQEFDFEVVYRPGSKMQHADALSRNPVETALPVMSINMSEEDWLQVIQSQDAQICKLRDILKKKPTNREEKEVHENYLDKNGYIQRKIDGKVKIVIPKAGRFQMTQIYHDKMGHFGVEKTLDVMKKYFWFTGMRKYIQQYIRSCMQCLYNKQPGGKRPGKMNLIDKIGIPMHTLHLDHLGPFTTSSIGNKYLIVAIDAFTKFIFAKAVKSTKTIPVENFLLEIFQVFGVPRRIICDRGTAFTAKRFADFCQSKGIKCVLNATATPRANGQCERFNRTILSAIRTTVTKEEAWDKCIGDVKWAVNNVPSDTTGKTAHNLMFGYQARGLNDAKILNESVEDWAIEDMEPLRKLALENTERAQQKYKENFDKHRCVGQKYEVGDLVVIKQERATNDGKSRKLLSCYNGPYQIAKVLTNDRYVVRDIPGMKRKQKPYTGIQAVDRLKKFNWERAVMEDDKESEESD